MLDSEIEAFRKQKGLSVNRFCELTHIRDRQYKNYLNRSKAYLSVKDAVRLMAAFPDNLSINSLLIMCGRKPLKLAGDFPRLCFSCNEEYDSRESEVLFRGFYIKTVLKLFSHKEAITLLNAMAMPWDPADIGLPFMENMYSLMDCLRIIRKIRFTKFSIPAQTVLSHFQRKRNITKLGDLCEYEAAFGSGGAYLLSELMYLNVRKGYGIRLWQ